MNCRKSKRSCSPTAERIAAFFKWLALLVTISCLWTLILTDSIEENRLPFIAAASLLTAILAVRVLYLLNLVRITRGGVNSLVDELDGIEFEHFCARVLKRSGFRSVHVTKSSGDFGADITALDTEGGSWVFQCKRYSSNIGNAPIQEVSAARLHYNAQFAAVITNQHFTDAARQLAEENDILLIEREKLFRMNKRPSKNNCRKLRKIAAPSPAVKHSGKIGGVIILDDSLDN